MTRSEEQLRVGTETVDAGKARLRKYVVTEQQTVTVPVSHEEVRIEREPVTDANRDAAMDGPSIAEAEHEVVLTEEQLVVSKEATPVERVRLTTDTVTEGQEVTEEVRKEQIESSIEGVDDPASTATPDTRTLRTSLAPSRQVPATPLQHFVTELPPRRVRARPGRSRGR